MMGQLDAFSREMRAIYQRAQKECNGYRPTLFLREINEHGPLEAAKKFLSTQEAIQTGLIRLADCGRLDISMECLVLRYAGLFTEAELITARQRLDEAASAHPDLFADPSTVCRPKDESR